MNKCPVGRTNVVTLKDSRLTITLLFVCFAISFLHICLKVFMLFSPDMRGRKSRV